MLEKTKNLYLSITVICLFSCLFLDVAFAANGDSSKIAVEHNVSQPIEISATQLEVIEPENKAIFSGSVIATQGDLSLRAERMTVFYKKNSDKSAANNAESSKSNEEKSSEETGGGGGGVAGSISKITVDGNVVLATKKENAQGNNGEYNVSKQEIILNGDVRLSQGKNILRGTRLEYSLKTGKSILIGGVSVKSDGKTTSPPRVRGVFVPDNKK